ncbi:DUF2878 domain-containing protein [Psychromonas sp. Urea-02u-13]|uniref:DUF2878 domain-containing protein n=1 Tax=Psychromonas sp. Urea-02u-13 TaxID=2058326 RepID=UPI000C34726E|nr:DUF2878 domain-containing protein [Psychromonas sp. Urea-02u-13]PKG38481.1 hypothetical protein CXF74_13355 [Psychromonas sp. Urea-02u-13]
MIKAIVKSVVKPIVKPIVKPMFNLSPRAFMVFNFLSFQSAWFVAVTLQQQGILILITLLICHFLMSRYRVRDFYSVFFITLLGSLVDLICAFTGLFLFDDGHLLPLWLLLLWANFALTFHYSMGWLMRSPLVVQAILGGVSGSLSYFSAYKLGAVDYAFTTELTIFALVVIWSVTLPVYVFIASTIQGK